MKMMSVGFELVVGLEEVLTQRGLARASLLS